MVSLVWEQTNMKFIMEQKTRLNLKEFPYHSTNLIEAPGTLNRGEEENFGFERN